MKKWIFQISLQKTQIKILRPIPSHSVPCVVVFYRLRGGVVLCRDAVAFGQPAVQIHIGTTARAKGLIGVLCGVLTTEGATLLIFWHLGCQVK